MTEPFSGAIPLITTAVSQATSGGVTPQSIQQTAITGAQQLVSIGLSQGIGNSVLANTGINLANGLPITDQQISQAVSNIAGSQIKGVISTTLASAGPVGSLIAPVLNSTIGQGIEFLTGSIFGALTGGGGAQPGNYTKAFPGGSPSDPDANYGGSAYTLGSNGPDVVFSIKVVGGAATGDFNSGSVVASALSTTSALLSGSGKSPVPSVADIAKTGIQLASSNFSPSTLGSVAKLGAPFVSGTAVSASTLASGVSSFLGSGPTAGAVGQAVASNFQAFGSVPADLANTAVSSAFSAGLTSLPDLQNATFGFSTALNDSLSSGSTPSWNFICAPEDISWETNNTVDRIKIFGTNQPPVVSGSRGMRELTLGNAVVEGFVRGKTVEDKILALEQLMNMSLDGKSAFVNVPVYQVFANGKSYGDANGEDGGYFVIKSVKVKEKMRDLDGKSTRAIVDISFTQVPPYQVNTGRDLASATQTGAKATLTSAVDQANQKVQEAAKVTPPTPKPPKPAR